MSLLSVSLLSLGVCFQCEQRYHILGYPSRLTFSLHLPMSSSPKKKAPNTRLQASQAAESESSDLSADEDFIFTLMKRCRFNRARAEAECLHLTRQSEPTPVVEEPQQIIDFYSKYYSFQSF